VTGIADPLNGHIDEVRISHIQRSDRWIATISNNMSAPGASAVGGAVEQEGGEPPPLGRRRCDRLPDGRIWEAYRQIRRPRRSAAGWRAQ
jgi:hypothetical protein